jgi:hypothetical protein
MRTSEHRSCNSCVILSDEFWDIQRKVGVIGFSTAFCFVAFLKKKTHCAEISNTFKTVLIIFRKHHELIHTEDCTKVVRVLSTNIWKNDVETMPTIIVWRKLSGNYNCQSHEMVKALSGVHRRRSNSTGSTNCELSEYRANSHHEDISIVLG